MEEWRGMGELKDRIGDRVRDVIEDRGRMGGQANE
jgi:hypothetical protein